MMLCSEKMTMSRIFFLIRKWVLLGSKEKKRSIRFGETSRAIAVG